MVQSLYERTVDLVPATRSRKPTIGRFELLMVKTNGPSQLMVPHS